MKYRVYDEKESRDKILSALKAALAAKSHESTMAHEFLGDEWEEFCDDIYNRGVLSGLALSKKAWDKGLGREEISENEIYYHELLSSDVAE